MPKESQPRPISKVRVTLPNETQDKLLLTVLSKNPFSLRETFGSDLIITMPHSMLGSLVMGILKHNELHRDEKAKIVNINKLQIEEVDIRTLPERITFKYPNVFYDEETYK